jgi:membrane associated rhomboid family serine protease
MNNSSGSFMGSMPAVTKNLLFINAIIWLGSMVLKQNAIDITSYLGLHYWGASKFNPAQLITYMFLHDTSSWNNGFMHIFFNMFSLWMFGCVIERVVGAKKYLFYYISCGLGAALAQEIVWTITWQSQLAVSPIPRALWR